MATEALAHPGTATRSSRRIKRVLVLDGQTVGQPALDGGMTGVSLPSQTRCQLSAAHILGRGKFREHVLSAMEDRITHRYSAAPCGATIMSRMVGLNACKPAHGRATSHRHTLVRERFWMTSVVSCPFGTSTGAPPSVRNMVENNLMLSSTPTFDTANVHYLIWQSAYTEHPKGQEDRSMGKRRNRVP